MNEGRGFCVYEAESTKQGGLFVTFLAYLCNYNISNSIWEK